MTSCTPMPAVDKEEAGWGEGGMEKFPSVPLAPRCILPIQVGLSFVDAFLDSLFEIEILLTPV